MDPVTRLFPGPGNRRTTPGTGQVSCWLLLVRPLTYLQTGTGTVPPASETAS
jgi:hypothetical protein